MHLEKILSERLDYAPEIDTSEIASVVGFTIKEPAALKEHLMSWKHNEMEFAQELTEAVRMAAMIDMCVYDELTCILEAVQAEIMRIKLLKKWWIFRP